MGRGRYLGEFEQLVLLALVRVGGKGYGMTVRREIVETTGRDVSIGSVYATLDRLEAKELLSSVHSEPLPDRGGKPRRTFTVEPRGITALHHSRDLFNRMWQGVPSRQVSRGTK
jgi:DNA-binding PadR family transcriptional regulator